MIDSKHWALWLDGSRPPDMNMALDELLVPESVHLRKAILRFYSWGHPSVSIGYTQRRAAAPAEGFIVVRRPTGGGVVFHGEDLTYGLAAPAGHKLMEYDRMESYRIIHEAIAQAYAQWIGGATLAFESAHVDDRSVMACFRSPSQHDVMSADGAKIAGAAQRRTRQGLLQQGSIDLATLGISRAAAAEALVTAFQNSLSVIFEQYHPTDSILEEAAALSAAKYATDEWNLSR